MSEQLPDPLRLWIDAASAPVEQLQQDSMAASLIALWSSQEGQLKSLAALFGQARLGELAVELLHLPLRRQAQLIVLAPKSKPQQTLALSNALAAWLLAQVSLLQAAAGDVQLSNSTAANCESVLQAWVQAFGKRQRQYLSGAEGQRCFARLCAAWTGLGAVVKAVDKSLSGNELVKLQHLGGEAEQGVLLLADPCCPLPAFEHIEGGLLPELAKHYKLSVVQWSDMRGVEDFSQLWPQLQQQLDQYCQTPKHRVLDLTSGGIGRWLLPKGKIQRVYHSASESRLARLLQGCKREGIALPGEDMPGELLAVLCDALYPDWAVSAWLADGPNRHSALATRRAWLDAMPSLTVALLESAYSQSKAHPESATDILPLDQQPVSLPELLAGKGAKQLRALLHSS